jgi:large subunit ribosomal protein L17
MRHGKRGRKLGRTKSHRKAMLANMSANLFRHKQIKTTDAKAKETRKIAERLITLGKKGDLNARRKAARILPTKEDVNILFHDIAPQYEERNGGYTRIVKIGRRNNDAAPMSIIELVDFQREAPTDTEE